MRIKLTRDHDDITPERTIAFRADTEVTTTREVGRRVVKAKAAHEVKPGSEAKDEAKG